MGKPSDYYEHSELNKKVLTYEGFSFPAFFFTPIWCVLRGLYLQAILSFALAFVGVGFIIWIIAGFKGNEWYKESLVKNGYKKAV